MKGRKKLIVIVVAVAALGAIGAGVAVGSGVANDTDTPITGEAYELATAAALEHTGGGRVTETEVGDEESYYEVEVTLDDGRQADVQLDENFNVVGEEIDDENEDEDGEGHDDDSEGHEGEDND